MVQNIWVRGKEFANFLGLLCGSTGIIIIGVEIPNKLVTNLGIWASGLFIALLVFSIVLAIRDAICHRNQFWVGIPK